MRYIGFVTKGLEGIAEQEISRKFPDMNIVEVGSKRLIFETNTAFKELINLRIVDDLCIYVDKKPNIKSVDSLLDTFQNIEFQKYFGILNDFRRLHNTFSFTLSLVGFEKVKTEDLLIKLSKSIRDNYQWEFTERDHSNFDIRIFIDKGELLIGIRLSRESLYNRSYKTLSKPGSLKPTIAAAMVEFAMEGKKGNIVDTFCGSGTILCEGLVLGNTVFGSDIDSESVEVTQNNLKQINYSDKSVVLCQSALKTSFPNNYFDYAISNLPWDKQIKVESITNLYIGALNEYKRIIKKGGVLCVLITKADLFIKHAKYILNPKSITRLPISLLGQSPEIILIRL